MMILWPQQGIVHASATVEGLRLPARLGDN